MILLERVGAAILLAAASAASGCLSDGFGIFWPVATDAYELPDNHIPASLLEERTLRATDEVELASVWAWQPEPAAAPTAAFFHGQGGNIDDAWPWVMALWDRGYNVAVVDYRGFGKSRGEPSEAGLYDDAAVFFAAVAASPRLDPSRIVLWGHSLGSAVASYLALTAPARALVLEAPFTSIRDMVEGSSPYAVPADWFTRTSFDTLGRIGDIDLPLVVAHGTDDRRIPYWMGKKVYERAREPKRFVRVRGAGHSDVLRRAGDAILAAVAELAPAAVP